MEGKSYPIDVITNLIKVSTNHTKGSSTKNSKLVINSLKQNIYFLNNTFTKTIKIYIARVKMISPISVRHSYHRNANYQSKFKLN